MVPCHIWWWKSQINVYWWLDAFYLSWLSSNPFMFVVLKHVYIPLLFFSGADYIDAPMPYMMGLHSGVDTSNLAMDGVSSLENLSLWCALLSLNDGPLIHFSFCKFLLVLKLHTFIYFYHPYKLFLFCYMVLHYSLLLYFSANWICVSKINRLWFLSSWTIT